MTERADGRHRPDVGPRPARSAPGRHLAGEAPVEPLVRKPSSGKRRRRSHPAEIEADLARARLDVGGMSVGTDRRERPGTGRHAGRIPTSCAQHVRQDAAVAERGSSSGVSIRTMTSNSASAVRPPRTCGTVTSPLAEPASRARSSYTSRPVRPERRDRLAGPELQRQHPHAHEVAAVNPLEALGDDRAHAEQQGALGRPVARRPGAVLLARQHDQRHALRPVAHRPRRRCSSARRRAGGASSRPRCPAPAGCAAGCWRTCRAPSPRGCPRRAPYELKSCGCTPCAIRYCPAGCPADRSGRRDVVGGHAVAQHREHPSRRPMSASGAGVTVPSRNGGLRM